MKISITKDVLVDKALALVLAADEQGLYYSHLDGNLKCSHCGWDVELHRNMTGKDAHFEHKDGNPEVCIGPF